MYTKHEVNVLNEKKLKNTFKGKKRRKQELRIFQKSDISESKESKQFFNNNNASSKSNDS